MPFLFTSAICVAHPPEVANWGTMIADAQNYFDTEWWLAVIPGVAICLAATALLIRFSQPPHARHNRAQEAHAARVISGAAE